jgi:hypothetical protein
VVSIALRNQQTSPLLRLSAELRNQIYFHVLHVGTWTPNATAHASTSATPKGHYVSILSVCRQLHHETSLLPFRLDTFSLDGDAFAWLCKLTTSQKAAITRVSKSQDFAGCRDYRLVRLMHKILCEQVPRYGLVLPAMRRMAVVLHARGFADAEGFEEAGKDASYVQGELGERDGGGG